MNEYKRLNEDERWSLWKKMDEQMYKLVQNGAMSGDEYINESDQIRKGLGLLYSYERDWRGVRYW